MKTPDRQEPSARWRYGAAGISTAAEDTLCAAGATTNRLIFQRSRFRKLEQGPSSMTKPLTVGLIGYGFMGRTHSNAYYQVNHFFDLHHRPVLKAVCGRSADKTKEFADKWGYESVETDWRKLVERKDIDLIDICTPNNTHAEIAIAAAKNGK